MVTEKSSLDDIDLIMFWRACSTIIIVLFCQQFKYVLIIDWTVSAAGRVNLMGSSMI